MTLKKFVIGIKFTQYLTLEIDAIDDVMAGKKIEQKYKNRSTDLDILYIKEKVKNLGGHNRWDWTEVVYLRDHYLTDTQKQIAKDLGRSVHSVSSKIKQLKFTKNKE